MNSCSLLELGHPSLLFLDKRVPGFRAFAFPHLDRRLHWLSSLQTDTKSHYCVLWFSPSKQQVTRLLGIHNRNGIPKYLLCVSVKIQLIYST